MVVAHQDRCPRPEMNPNYMVVLREELHLV
jgi:hypothetical protein